MEHAKVYVEKWCVRLIAYTELVKSNKWKLELISSFSRPGLVKFNKIYIEKVN